ncbi:MAG: TonB-dependent receptor [Saprospiraceae bacterium]|nr:TonB-dependent receptor [Saprospiraceae bacterium]
MKNYNFKLGTLSFLFVLLSFTSIFSQGTISGTVLDKESGETMISATVLVEGTDAGEVTDFDGKYQIKIDAGTYDIVFSYVGYPEMKIEGVVVKDGGVTVIDALLTMEKGGVQIEEIVVQAEAIKTTENAILVTRLNANRFTDGISQGEMAKLNISSADQAVAKVVGVSIADGSVVVRGLGDRYSTAQLNGASIPSANPYKNSVNLDLIPAGLLSNIITSKTFTPDQPGTFTGGNVNIETKSFPETKSFKISLSTGYNTQSSFQNNFLTHDGGDLDWLGYDDGYRSRSSLYDDENYADALLRSAGTKARNDDAMAAKVEELYDATLTNMVPTTTTTPMNHGIGFSFGNQYEVGGRDLGVILSANYSRSFRHYDAGLRNYALESTTSQNLNQNFNLGGTTSIESPTVGGMVGLSYKINPSNRISFNTLYNHSADKSTRSFSGEHNTYQVTFPEIFEFRELYWLERSLLNNMLLGQHLFGSDGVKLEWIASASVATQREPELRYFGNEFDPKDLDDPTDDRYAIRAPSEYDYPNHFFRKLSDEQFEGKLDLTFPVLHNLSKGNKIKTGILYSLKNRIFDERRYSVQEKSAENYNGDAAAFFSDENSGVIEKDANVRNVIGNYIVDDTRASNSYIGSEKVMAIYAMGTIEPIENLDIVFGTRIENASLPVESADSLYTAGKLSVLPSINLRYALRNKMNLRAAFTQTVARPNLRELAPFSNFDFRTGAFIVGNPKLKITSITNLDLRWEWMPRIGEILAISTYLKSFINPIVLVNLGKSNPEFQYQNVDKATVYGVELEYRKNLGFISPALNNFKLGANLSCIYSEVDIDAEELADIRSINPDASDKRTFFNQSPYIVNTNLVYSNSEKNIDATLSFNIFGDRLVIVGQEGTPDIFEQTRPKLDFTISKKIKENLSVRLSAKNLLDPEYKLQSSFNGNDYIYSNYNLGRTISMSLSYTIN